MTHTLMHCWYSCKSCGVRNLQGLPLLTMPTEFDETGCISQGGALNRAPSSNFPAMSFTWPPGASAPSEQELPMPLGPFTSINPLANAIDIKVEGLAAQVGVRFCVFWVRLKAHGMYVVLSRPGEVWWASRSRTATEFSMFTR